jgi:hypothetical protein
MDRAAAEQAYFLVGELFTDEIRKSPNDLDGAWARAVKAAKAAGLLDAQFPQGFFEGPVKEIALARIREAARLAKEFNKVVNELLDAGQMSPDEILERVERQFGPTFVGLCRQFDQFKVH